MTLPLLAWTATVFAADHAEAPGAAADAAADIADFYAWVDNDRLTTIVTFAGLTPAGGSANYDADVLYTVHVDNDGDNESDVQLRFRFGQNAAGDWGVQVTGVPGSTTTAAGAVDTAVSEGDVQLYAGLRDDPFFFDLTGFEDTLATQTLSFVNTRDSLATTNVTAIAFEAPVAAFLGSGTTLNLWATTARK